MSDFFSLMILSGMLLFIQALQSQAVSCDYQYDTQPAQVALSCGTLTNFVLRCQVSSARSNFSIGWHYSNFEPDSSSILTAIDIDNSRNAIISNEWTHNTTSASLVSELSISKFTEKDNINGYYWCSVNSSNEMNTMTPNPSIVLHILHRIECTTKLESKCAGEINFYSAVAAHRCADQNTSVDIVEAQNCTIGDRLDPTIIKTTGSGMGSQNIDGSEISSMLTPKINITASTLPLTLGIIAGASMGGLILVLLIIIGFLLICVVRMKIKNKHQKRGSQIDPTTPFDNIHTYTSVPVTDKDKVDESKMVLELNLSYECPQDITSDTSQPNDNIYASIN